ncbi:MAG TPA: hypothetical protein VIM47_00955 [Dermatophilaceae bacterium]
MTWSEWIQAPDYLTAPDALNAPYYGVMDSDATDYAHSGGPVNTATVVAGLQTIAATGASPFDPGGNTNIRASVIGTTEQNPEDFGGYHHDCEVAFAQTVANLTIPTATILAARDAYPPTLSALTEGVDFTLIPDTSDFVEYEPTSSTLIGWQDWVVPLRCVETFNGMVVPQAAPVRVAYADPPITDWAFGGIPPWQTYGAGTELATLTTALGAPGDYVTTGVDWGVVSRDTTANVTIPLSVMGVAAAVSLFMQATHLGGGAVPGVVDVGGGPAGGIWGVESNLDHTVPMQYAYRMPRFRYWKITPAPSAIPLRQVQRDDGLGRSVVRARGTHSVQKSIRQRGYR